LTRCTGRFLELLPVCDDLLAPAGGHTILVTLHRRESFGPPLEAMCDALQTLAERTGDRACFVCTVHPNPNVSGALRKRLESVRGIRLIQPLDYPDFVASCLAAISW
jgi:UDP-N-acetylglucosamine 2-epimerase (non-hydrolysing)